MPKVVVKVTDMPGVTGAPVPSVSAAWMADELIPSAQMLVGLAVRTMATGAPPKPT